MPEDMDWTARKLDYEPPEIDTTKAHSARLYDYLLGGKDNYPPDREAAARLLKVLPAALVTARQNRLFMRRLVRYLAAEEGTDAVMTAPDLTATLDLSRPVALTILSTLHFITDDDQAYGLVGSYLRQLPPGSFLALSMATDGIIPEGDAPVVSALGAHGIAARSRSRTEVSAFFDGLELSEPGVVPVHHWRPDADAAGVRDTEVTLSGGLARKA